MHRARQVLCNLQLALHERLIDDYFGGDVGEFASLPGFHLLAHGFEVSLHSIDTDRNTIDQRKQFRVFSEHRRGFSLINFSQEIPCSTPVHCSFVVCYRRRDRIFCAIYYEARASFADAAASIMKSATSFALASMATWLGCKGQSLCSHPLGRERLLFRENRTVLRSNYEPARHTRGFYERAAVLYHPAREMHFKKLFWAPVAGGRWRIDW